MSQSDSFLAFVACAGCGEAFPVRSRGALARAKWCSDRCRKQQYSTPCVDCGRPRNGSDGPNAHARCLPCANALLNEKKRAAKRLRDDMMLELRGRGLNNTEIAGEMGLSAAAVATAFTRMRREGRPAPRSPYAGGRLKYPAEALA